MIGVWKHNLVTKPVWQPDHMWLAGEIKLYFPGEKGETHSEGNQKFWDTEINCLQLTIGKTSHI